MRVTRILLTFCFVITLAMSALAQGRYNYLSVGALVGLAHYNGDLTKVATSAKFPTAQLASLKDNNLGVGAFVNYHFHPHMHVRGGLYYSSMKAADGTDRAFRSASMSTTLLEASAILVYEFKATRRGYAYRPKLNFFVMGGLGVMNSSGTLSQPDPVSNPSISTFLNANRSASVSISTTSLAIPFGLGVRYKLAKQWDLRAEAGLRYTLTDKLDGYNTIFDLDASSPGGILQTTRKINDWYAFSGISLSYILNDSERCPTPKRARKKFLFF